MELEFRIFALTFASSTIRARILCAYKRIPIAIYPISRKYCTSNGTYIATLVSKADDTSQGQCSPESAQRRHLFRSTAMISGYSRLGRIGKALQVFDEMPVRDVAAWNAVIKRCVQCGELRLARDLLDMMPERNVISWTTIVDGLARCGKIAEAEELFFHMPQRDTAAWNSMISGYFSNGRVADAVEIFERMSQRNVISWTAMICGLDQNGQSKDALAMFQQMLASEMQPTSNTFASVLTACSNAANMLLGPQVHGSVIKYGFLSDAFISTSLVTFYAKCKQMESSQRILEEMRCENVASWTAIVTGYGLNGKYQCAIDAFHSMKRESIIPNQSTFTSVLNCCGELQDLEKGREIHGNAIKSGFGFDLFVGNSLIFMYSKCGEMDGALTTLKNLMERNIISWNSIITGCAQNGQGFLAFKLYKEMVLNLIKPDGITFIGLLTSCSHFKMVDMARYFFRLLHHDQSLEPKLEHYICMVDVLGRSGNFEEAEDFINNMPVEPDKAVWLSLLSACRGHRNQLRFARQAAEKILNMEPDCSAAYTLLSNMYASEDQWDDVSLVRSTMRSRKVSKEPGQS